MMQLLFISLLFISCTENANQKANLEIVSYQKQVEGFKSDSVLISIQNKIKTGFVQSLRSKNDRLLIELNTELKEYSEKYKQNIILYWQAYAQFYTSIYYLTNEYKNKSEHEVDKGIGYLNSIKSKNSEDYALLAMLQGYSIQFKGAQAMFIGPKATKNARRAIALDSTNLRAYFVYGSNNFYTPEQYGGGKEAERYLLKAISIPAQKEESNILPSWGKEEAYEILIRLYIKKENWDLAKKYFQEGIKEFPDSYIINQLKPKLHVNDYPFLSLIFNPNATAQSIIPQANQIKNSIISIADSLYVNQQRLTLKTMITDSLNIEKALKWSLDSDRKTTAQAMFKIMTTDLRDELNNIKIPILVFGSWYEYKDYEVTKESVYSNLKNQS